MELNQITLPCLELSQSVAFYKKLGFVQIVSNPPTYARFECTNGATFSLHLCDPVPHPTGVVVYFEVPSVDDSVRELYERGLTFDVLPTDQPWLWREAYLKDPAGNVICIYHAGRNRLSPPWRLPG